MQGDYKTKKSLEERQKESKRIRTNPKFKNRVPIIAQPAKNCVYKIDRTKYLVPADLTMAQFAYVIRKRLKLNPEAALFFYVNNRLAAMSDLLKQVDHDSRDEDGFLYITFNGENTFG